MRRTMAGLFAVVLVLILAVGCGTTDSLSSDGGTSTTTTTTTETKPITYSDGKATLPLTGFHGMDREIIIETEDLLSFFQKEFVFVKNAYHYQDGRLLKLEAFETEIVINEDATKQDKRIEFPINILFVTAPFIHTATLIINNRVFLLNCSLFTVIPKIF